MINKNNLLKAFDRTLVTLAALLYLPILLVLVIIKKVSQLLILVVKEVNYKINRLLFKVLGRRDIWYCYFKKLSRIVNHLSELVSYD